MLKVKAALSMSAATSVMLLDVSSFVVIAASTTAGASFTAVTVIETVATLESRLPSFALYVKLSGPL